MSKSDIVERSALVVAHPDDEALWFSSILDSVERVVISFLDIASRPDWSEGRRRAIAQLPLSGVRSFGLTESEVFNCADWWNPELTDYGLAVSQRPEGLPNASFERYRSNFSALVEQLTDELHGCRNVITHNPWGEYGHEEHVQVFRAVQQVQKVLNYRLWFTNYCSNKSHNLMLRYLSGFNSDYVTLNTNLDLASRMESTYRANNCWTWPFDDYQWFRQECLVVSEPVRPRAAPLGRLFPFNYLRIEAPWDRPQNSGMRQRAERIVRRLWNSSQ